MYKNVADWNNSDLECIKLQNFEFVSLRLVPSGDIKESTIFTPNPFLSFFLLKLYVL